MVDWELFYNRLRTPDFLAGFEIQNRIGGGAFGEVYKAEKRSIGKVYAVKFLKVTEGDVVERELEQVSYFASIDHPNLVTVEDVGVVIGVPYVIMGYAGADTLARRMKRGELDADSMLRYFVQACRGVLALHDRRLAHFDLKPSNIFIRGDVARVGDYGLAKLLSDGRKTLSFGRGTPHYMAPEMLKNRADHRADIYSLGIILYEGLAGSLPFGLGAETIVREDDDPVVFPPGFPASLRPVVECATALDPDLRYDSVLELLADMGQTARQGDSVRVGDLADGAALPAPDDEPGPEPGRDGDDDTPVSDELRRTAAELARGAMGVARGVWDGVVTRSSEAIGRGPAEDVADRDEPDLEQLVAAGAEQAEVVSIRTLGEADDGDDGDDGATQAERGMLAILATERTRVQGGARQEESRLFRPWEALPAVGARTAGRTVPVPPAAEGGLIGSMLATLALGFEVMVALVSGPILYALRGLGRGVDRALRVVPGALGAVLKLLVFMLLLAALGALLAVLVLYLRLG